jgi:branched-chain amino acid transport system permease protein
MTALGDFLVNATALSSLYAILAIGFTLVFGVGRVLNFAHAAFITIGAYAAYQVSNPNAWGLHVWFGFFAAVIVTALVGAVVYRTAIRYVDPQSTVGMIITMSVAFFILFAIRAIYGDFGIAVPTPAPGIGAVAGVEVQYHLVVAFAVSWLAIAFLLAFVNHTDTGTAIVATSMNVRGARLAGIDTDRVNLYTWTVAAGLAGAGGMLLAGFQGGGWFMGIEPLVLSFAIVVLGGLGSIKGSVVGAHVIGFLETAVVSFVDPALGGMASLVVLVVVLLVRPSGLWGHTLMEGR